MEDGGKKIFVSLDNNEGSEYGYKSSFTWDGVAPYVHTFTYKMTLIEKYK